MREQPPRDPAHYHQSTHALQRRKNRGIRTEEVSRTITEGIVQAAKGGYPNVKFVHVPMGAKEALAVVANADRGVIISVYWDVECTHPAIVELRNERGLTDSQGAKP